MVWNGLPCNVEFLTVSSHMPLQISSACSEPADCWTFSKPGTPGIAAIVLVQSQSPASFCSASCCATFGFASCGCAAGVAAAFFSWATTNVGAATSAAASRTTLRIGSSWWLGGGESLLSGRPTSGPEIDTIREVLAGWSPSIGGSLRESFPPTLRAHALGGRLARRGGALLRQPRPPGLGPRTRLFVHL